MGGDATESELAGSRPVRARPHWWAVLAVSLSLLALVAAKTTDHKGASGPPRHTDAASSPSRSDSPPLPARVPSGTTTTTSGQSPGAVIPSTSTPLATPPGTSVDRAHVVVRPSTPTTTTSTTPVATTSGTGSSPPPAPVIYTGYLQQPDDSSASYPFTASGPMLVSASWPGTSTLSLTVTCPQGTQSEEGSSSVAIELPNDDGPCEVTLKETLVAYDAVSYTVTIGPPDGG